MLKGKAPQGVGGGKGFLSPDSADHILSERADGEYAAAVIAA